MQRHLIVHSHQYGLTLLEVVSSQPTSPNDVVAALYLDNPEHYELGRDGENLEVAQTGATQDVSGLVLRLQWVRGLKLGSPVKVNHEEGSITGTIEGVSAGSYVPMEPDLGDLFTAADDRLSIRTSDGNLVEAPLSRLRPLDGEAHMSSVKGKRRVVVNRTITQQLTFTIDESESDEDAGNQALDMAGDYDFGIAPYGDPDYSVESVSFG